MCTAYLACSPARAGTVFSIQPSTMAAAPGDVGDSFDVVLTNNGPGRITVGGFSFEVSVTDPNITFTGADFSTAALPYIFAGDSFDEDNSLPLNYDFGQTLDATDTYDVILSGVTLTSGESLALGEVQFDVAYGAATGPVTLSFTGGAGANSLSDALGNFISVDSLNNGEVTLEAQSSTSEPASWLLLGGGLAALGLLRVNARRLVRAGCLSGGKIHRTSAVGKCWRLS